MARERGVPCGESLTRAERLRKRSDFLRCYRKGRRGHGALAVLYSAPNDLEHPRMGMTVSKKVGGAVLRVRLKRRIREIFRRWSERSRLPAFDLVVHVKPQMATASFEQIQSELRRLLRKLISNSQQAS